MLEFVNVAALYAERVKYTKLEDGKWKFERIAP